MRLTKQHIGGLYTIRGADPDWVYQLIDVRSRWLLFCTFDGYFYKERTGREDWVPFKPMKKWPDLKLEYAWSIAKGGR